MKKFNRINTDTIVGTVLSFVAAFAVVWLVFYISKTFLLEQVLHFLR